MTRNLAVVLSLALPAATLAEPAPAAPARPRACAS